MRVKEKEAVSPVIGVILMVAITVILATVVYLWVIGWFWGKETPRVAFVCGQTGDIYIVRATEVGKLISIKAFEVKVINNDGTTGDLTRTSVEDMYSKKVHGVIFNDNDANALLNAGDTFILDYTPADQPRVTDRYKHGDHLIITYVPTGAQFADITLIGL